MRRTTLTSFKRGFTLLEVVFVITILGIIASIGASLIAQVYESYIVQRALYRTSAKAEIAALQIANRLTYRISSAVIGRKLDGTYLPLDQVPDETYKVLEWIGYDNDSFTAGDMSSATLANRVPGWSGFCDVDSTDTNKSRISTPGSDLNKVNAIIGKLSNSSKTIGDAAIIFAGHEYNSTKNYIANCMGFTDSSCISPINSIVSATVMTLSDDNNSKVMTDQYKLAWSAYAVVPTRVTGSALTDRGFKSSDMIYDLKLYYNYQPWNNAPSSYADANVPNSTLVTNVRSFRFVGKGDTVRFKICVAEAIGDGNITSCKEKAVIR
ncbi:type II secretion system protein [Sulfurovum riftiae]|uniref:Prepilin-type N-terminal cleavage/methylation domain-containing protein n=1 Tax=Sulfurovum riftiae TaxID=1630136 RepID=A0A151CFN8_9BACT|nr:prepilin-type N-terminal cleavage/methylation domain-containing protein [Sulfurovum riftiae]KYJ86289.1 hypothetical protein AS592_05695 [Sulfurovum riftiae]